MANYSTTMGILQPQVGKSYIVKVGLGGGCNFVCTQNLCKMVKKFPPTAWAVGGLFLIEITLVQI